MHNELDNYLKNGIRVYYQNHPLREHFDNPIIVAGLGSKDKCIKSAFDGFQDFYRQAKERNIEHWGYATQFITESGISNERRGELIDYIGNLDKEYFSNLVQEVLHEIELQDFSVQNVVHSINPDIER